MAYCGFSNRGSSRPKACKPQGFFGSSQVHETAQRFHSELLFDEAKRKE
jgi:hypothetical protein